MGWRVLRAPLRRVVFAAGAGKPASPPVARSLALAVPEAGRVTTTNSTATVGIVIKVRRAPKAPMLTPPVRAAAPVVAMARGAVGAVLTASRDLGDA